MKRLQQLKQFFTQRYERLPEKEKDDKRSSLDNPSSSSKQLFQLATLHPEGSSHRASSFPIAVLGIKGMTCAACSAAVENCLSSIAGVKKASVALLQETGEVVFDEAQVKPEDLVAAVEDAGFDGSLLSVRRPKQQLEVVRMRVTGMVCAACSTAVESALLSLPGVSRAAVGLAQGEVEVTFNAASHKPEDLVAAVDDAGFEALLLSQGNLESLSLKLGGVSTASDVTLVEIALRRVPGVSKALVSLPGGTVEVWYDGSATGPRDLIKAVERAAPTEQDDYSAELAGGTGNDGGAGAANQRELAYWWNLFTSSLFFTIPIFFVSMVLPMIPGTEPITSTLIFGFPCNQLVKWILATPVQFVVGWRFHKGAVKALRRGTANMDVLVSLGTNASYIYSVISVMHHHLNRHHLSHNYVPTEFFETSAMIISWVLLGKYLEAAAKGRTSSALASLMALAPDRAVVVTLDDSNAVVDEQDISAQLIHRGDIIKVLPGGKVPTDGTIHEGASYINEAMVTGEAEPKWKKVGDVVIGGTINTSNMLLMKATRVGSETVLSQIVRLVETAQMSKAPVQEFADRVSAIFVPIVVTLALITWVAWYICGLNHAFPASWLPAGHTPFLFALLFGIAVLVIACPCALGLATPTAVMVGTGVAAQMGILIKGGAALEHASHVNTVVFDKTGTVTRGKPSVTDCRLFTDRVTLTLPQLCRAVGAAEATSEHPLAKALLEFCKAQLLLSEGAECIGALHPAATSTSSFSAGELGAFPTAAAAVPSAVVAALSKEVANSSHHYASLAALLPKPQTVQVQPGFGITCTLTWDQVTGSTSSIPTGLASLKSLSAGSGSVPSSEAHQRRSVHSASGGGAAGASSQRSSGAGIGPSSSKGSASGSSVVKVAVGNRALMTQEYVDVPEKVESYMKPMETMGYTCVLVAVDGAVVGVMAITDPLKPEAAGVVTALQASGIHCVLLTGDNWRTARAIAAQLAVKTVHAEMLPKSKATRVRELQSEGRVVAMVGDGINDSPALAAADVGMAIGSGTDIAIEAADYVLMRNDLEDVLVALDISCKTFHRIRMNYLWAMGYNVVLIPVAAGVLYPFTHIRLPPWLAGMCMAFSSVSVVLSSLMLRRYRRPRGVLRDVVAHSC